MEHSGSAPDQNSNVEKQISTVLAGSQQNGPVSWNRVLLTVRTRDINSTTMDPVV